MSGGGLHKRVAGSFRDPAGFLFEKNGEIFRQVNNSCREDYDMLLSSGLYDELVGAGLMIPHEESSMPGARRETCYKVLKPEKIPFISYPYEWCFSQLKAAGLALLDIQTRALGHGMTLKDATAYNMQFRKGRAVLIDTISLEARREGEPWPAYAQFCRHFLAPLALVSLKDARLGQLSRIYIDGVPPDLASSLLGAGSWINLPLLTHLHIHARYQTRFADKPVDVAGGRMSKRSLEALVDDLRSAIAGLRWKMPEGGWGDYYADNTYSAGALKEKERLVDGFLGMVSPARTALDLGANTGRFSRLASGRGMGTISCDTDAVCVEKNYLACSADGETLILPLIVDLTNPGAGIGWENNERIPFIERAGSDVALALALVHHLAIGNNLPLDKIAGFFSGICGSLIIEFVPKGDPQVRRLLASREDIFPDYTKETFESAFGEFFSITKSSVVTGTERTIYLMANKKPAHVR